MITLRIGPTTLPTMQPTQVAKWMAQESRLWTTKLHRRTHPWWGTGLITKNPDPQPYRHKKGQAKLAVSQLLPACAALLIPTYARHMQGLDSKTEI